MGQYVQRKNEGELSMLEDPDIITTIKSKRISWACMERTDNQSNHQLEAEQ